MIRLSTLSTALSALLALLTGCGTLESIVPDATTAAVRSKPSAIRVAGEDSHWIQDSDVFFLEAPWTSDYAGVLLGKVLTPATAASKNEAKIFALASSKEVWSPHVYRTRVAQPGDYTLGRTLICFDDNLRDDTYLPPLDKDSARTGSWWIGKVTDTSDAYKDIARVATFNVRRDACRAILP